jgi:hypothetical protein
LASSIVDGFQAALSFKGGKASSKIGSLEKVQTAADVARQAKILKSVEKSAAAVPGATKASIKATVDAARPTIMQAKASPLTF